MALARAVLGPAGRALSSVYFGGGTPTVLPPGDLARLLAAARDLFGLAPDAEITTEANPESVDERSLTALRAAGVTRLSLGMQSAMPHVLSVLDRRHEPGSVGRAVGAARAAGFDNLSLDLIYGTPGESAADWQASLDAALALGPDHVSAYALVVEPGTRLARRVARGEVAAPDDDDLADKYLQADAALEAAGLGWYEVSNWGRPCRHNLGYWRGADWWGIGPGAHSHVAGVRWWNVKHPAAYARRLAEGSSPGQAREVLDARTRRFERILLESRLACGLPLDVVPRCGARRGGGDGDRGPGRPRRLRRRPAGAHPARPAAGRRCRAAAPRGLDRTVDRADVARGARTTSPSSRVWVTAAISWTAWSKATWFTAAGWRIPATLRTYCRAAACTSSGVTSSL